MSATALYAYAVLPAGATPPAAPPVLPGAAPLLVREGAVAALVSPVPRALFEPGPECRMADPDWVAARAALHHAMVAAAEGPVLPLAFGALFSEAAPLRAWLAARGAALAEALAAVAGREEWGVALAEDAEGHAAYLDATDPALRDLAERRRRAGEGTAFLLDRRHAKALAAARAARRGAIGQRAASILARHAAQVAAAPARWTGLVPRGAVAALRAELEDVADEIAGSGLSLSLSGPWPPYAFAREALAHG